MVTNPFFLSVVTTRNGGYTKLTKAVSQTNRKAFEISLSQEEDIFLSFLYKLSNSLTRCFIYTPSFCHPERRNRLRDLGKAEDSC